MWTECAIQAMQDDCEHGAIADASSPFFRFSA
jgi:hypothetical protein